MDTLRVLIVDDQAMVRSGLRAMVSEAPTVTVVGKATNGLDAIRAVAEFTPHLIGFLVLP